LVVDIIVSVIHDEANIKLFLQLLLNNSASNLSLISISFRTPLCKFVTKAYLERKLVL